LLTIYKKIRIYSWACVIKQLTFSETFEYAFQKHEKPFYSRYILVTPHARGFSDYSYWCCITIRCVFLEEFSMEYKDPMFELLSSLEQIVFKKM
jgi:hypothetical protein